MVAISLYRGKLHRIPPDVPRRWLMPTRRISLRDFKLLVHKRAKALSRLHSANFVEKENQEGIVGEKEFHSQPNVGSSAAPDIATVGDCRGAAAPTGQGPSESRETDASITSLVEKTNSSQERTDQLVGDGAQWGSKDLQEEKVAASLVSLPTEEKDDVDATSVKEKRKKEIEEKLQTLNERKHQLVQVLRQILKAEEELKKQSSVVPLGIRDIGGESEDFGNTHTHHLQHMHSPSPSGASPLGKPSFSPLQNNTVPHIGRAGHFNPGQTQSSSNAIMNVMASPSRFAPSQGPPGNLSNLSVFGTHFVASSPPPAASGGTSAGFRDGRLTSPSWN